MERNIVVTVLGLVEARVAGEPVDLGGGGDGLSLMTALGDHLLVWDLDVEGWQAIACRAAGRNLTLEEWQQFGPAGPYQAT